MREWFAVRDPPQRLLLPPADYKQIFTSLSPSTLLRGRAWHAMTQLLLPNLLRLTRGHLAPAGTNEQTVCSHRDPNGGRQPAARAGWHNVQCASRKLYQSVRPPFLSSRQPHLWAVPKMWMGDQCTLGNTRKEVGKVLAPAAYVPAKRGANMRLATWNDMRWPPYEEL